MKKIQLFILATLVMLVGCTEITDRLDDLELRVDDIENTQISTLKQQIATINATIPTLEKADSDLKNYIIELQKQAADLEESVSETNQKITELKASLEGKIDADVAAAIAKLEALKIEVEAELSAINTYISQLQAKDKELADEITSLRTFVNSELSANSDWVTATFATIEQYNTLSDDVAGVKSTIESIHSSVENLEQNMAEIIKSEVATTLDEALADKVNEITEGYQKAITTAREEITEAYEQSIKNAISTLESSMKAWVNTQLAGYYTIAEMESKLQALQSLLEGKITASQQYLEGVISDLTTAVNQKIENNSSLIAALTGELASVKETVAEHTNTIIANAKAIEENTKSIKQNAKDILANGEDIKANSSLIAENKSLINNNNTLIKENKSAIEALKNRVSANEQSILDNATAIANNTADIANNAAAIANNTTAIANNLVAINSNTAEIALLQEKLTETAKSITVAYKNAIETAITTLEGEIRGHIASEISTVNASIEALTTRVTTLEKEVKTIKLTILNMQADIAELQEQIAAIIARIQSLSFVPDFSDGKATMLYTESAGTITGGTATLKYEVRPAAVADELVAVWQEALSVKALYTLTRADAGEFVSLDVESASAKDGILTVVAKGTNLADEFFRNEISANVRLEVSNGYNCITSDYVNIVPWTTNTVYIPDANFKAYLIENFDSNADNEISLAEAECITEIDIMGLMPQATSLAGIEYFGNLEKLNCSFNRLTALDLSSNTKLTYVDVSNNRLTSLDMSGCSALVEVNASNNKLTALDVSMAKGLTSLNVATNQLASLNVSQCKQLTTLNCTGNKLTVLDVSTILVLKELYCAKNQLQALNLTHNTAITTLDCYENALATLDLSKNVALTVLNCSKNVMKNIYIGSKVIVTLDCSNNQFVALNVAQFTKLTDLNCSHNALAQLDVTKLAQLVALNCSDNQLLSLNISCNTSLTTLDCSGNPAMIKLWVKDDAQQGAVDITKDNTTHIYFNNGGITIPDAELKKYLVNNYDDDGDGVISIAESDNITMVNCSGKGVTDLTGLESCTNLVTLNCSNNNITTIELPNMPQLKTVTCNNNPIEYINFDNCESLTYLNLQGTPSSAISGTAITITNYTQATTLYFTAKNTPFTSFTVENTPTLTTLEFYGEFTDVVVKNNTTLSSLVFHSPVVNATLSGNSVLESIDLSELLYLKTLDVQKCNLQSLDLTRNLVLTSLDCSDNAFTSIDLSKNAELATLIAENLALSKINLSNNVKLTKYSFTGNPDLVSIRVSTDFTMDNCLFTSVGNNTSLSIFNTVGDVFYYVGQCSTTFGSAGVVYEIDNGGLNGKMLSVEQTYLNWKYPRGYVNAEDWDNGANNMATIKALNPDLNEYPAFKWCDDYGTDWYLPSINELRVIYNNKSQINSTLSAHGFTTISYNYYWSSSCNNNTVYAYALDFSDGDSSNPWMDTNKYVRAVFAF